MEQIFSFQSKWYIRVIEFITLNFLIIFSLSFIFPTLNSNQLLFSFIIFVALILVSYLINYFRAESKYNSFGLNFDKFAFKHFFQGKLLVVFCMILFLILGSLLNAKIYYNGLTNTITYSFLLFTLQIFFQAASEELMFRGIVFQAFSQKFGNITSAIFLSLVFAALHLMNPNINTISLTNVFLAGIFFSACYIKTKSLWLGISFHFFWNWSEFVLLGSPISGLNFEIKPLIELKLLHISPSLYWILGGKFGIEEGAITTILLISLTYIVLKYVKYSPYISSTLLKMEYAESKYITK